MLGQLVSSLISRNIHVSWHPFDPCPAIGCSKSLELLKGVLG